MRHHHLFSLLLLLVAAHSTMLSQSRNHILLEIGGYGIHYSVNYQRVLKQSHGRQFEGRIGTCILPIGIGIPAALGFVLRPGPHKLQFSLGGNVFVDTRQFGGTDIFLYLGTALGYRFEPGNQLWYVFASVNPMLKTDPTPHRLIDPDPIGILSGGLGIGWKLK